MKTTIIAVISMFTVLPFSGCFHVLVAAKDNFGTYCQGQKHKMTEHKLKTETVRSRKLAIHNQNVSVLISALRAADNLKLNADLELKVEHIKNELNSNYSTPERQTCLRNAQVLYDIYYARKCKSAITAAYTNGVDPNEVQVQPITSEEQNQLFLAAFDDFKQEMAAKEANRVEVIARGKVNDPNSL